VFWRLPQTSRYAPLFAVLVNTGLRRGEALALRWSDVDLAAGVLRVRVNGVPLKVVSEVLGHASIGITGDIYGHVSPDVSRDALARPSEALG
jgi:integrase